MPAKKSEKRGRRCSVCQREFWPKTDSNTCLLCQNKLMVNPPQEHQQPQPAETAETTKTTGGRRRKKKFWIQCRKCDEFFWSTDKIHNKICPKCTQSNANISILATPYSPGKLSDYNN